MQRIVFAILVCIFFSSCLLYNESRNGYNPGRLKKVITEQDIQTFDTQSNLNSIYGFARKNYRKKDFTRLSLPFLALKAFDTHTKWPKQNMLPNGFNPSIWLGNGQNPGLGIRALHRKGLTGKGVAVAVIDKPINPDHLELNGRIFYHQVNIPSAKRKNRKHFHGIACASILCGTTCGVAPDAVLHYFDVPDDLNNSFNYCEALTEILDLNSELFEGMKIRVVSVSDNVSQKNREIYDRWHGLLKKAREQGIIVLFSDPESMHRIFTWGGCPPYADCNNPDNYMYSSWPRDHDSSHTEKMIVPADFRTTAMNYDSEGFTYWGESGFSWAIPYVAGLVALAVSINPAITQDELFEYFECTKTVNQASVAIINPQAFLDAVQK